MVHFYVTYCHSHSQSKTVQVSWPFCIYHMWNIHKSKMCEGFRSRQKVFNLQLQLILWFGITFYYVRTASVDLQIVADLSPQADPSFVHTHGINAIDTDTYGPLGWQERHGAQRSVMIVRLLLLSMLGWL